VAQRMNEDMLVRQARAVLDFNWTGEYTMPGPRSIRTSSRGTRRSSPSATATTIRNAPHESRSISSKLSERTVSYPNSFSTPLHERDPLVVQTSAPTLSGSGKAPVISRERSGQSLTLSRSIL